MQVWHVTISVRGRQPLFQCEQDRRAAVRSLARIAGNKLALFDLVDEHIHLNPIGERHEVGRLVQAVGASLSLRAHTSLNSAYIEPVESRRHMEHLLEYLLLQPTHHGLLVHPALWSGSCFCDLIGARLIDGLELKIAEVLPRFNLRQAYQTVGLGQAEIRPASDPEVRAQGAFKLVDAASATLCAGPDLTGNKPATVAARAAAASMASAVGIPTSEVAAALQITPRAARRLASYPVEERILAGIRLRLRLESAVEELQRVQVPQDIGHPHPQARQNPGPPRYRHHQAGGRWDER